MKSKLLFRFIVAFAVASAAPSWLCAGQAEEEAAIRASVTAYVDAFNRTTVLARPRGT